MKNILITGASGFVGTNLINNFISKDQYDIYAHSRNMNNFSDRRINLVQDYKSKTLDTLNIDTVVHLAGIAHDLSNQFKPEDYYKINFEGTKTAVDEFLKSDAKKFIFVSSIKAVCDQATSPVDEAVNPNPITDYGKSKLMAEEYIQSLAWGSKRFYILRPAMIHGPGNKGNLNTLYRFAKKGLPFPFGAFHNQRSFHSILNFNFIIKSLIDKNIPSETFHVADNGFLSTTELYTLVSQTLGKKARIWNVPKALVENTSFIAGKKAVISKLTESMMVSNQKVIKALETQLPVSLTEGLKSTIRSFDGN